MNVTLWVLQGLLAVLFLTAAGSKLFGDVSAVSMFDQIGLGQWLRYFVGVLELAGAVGLLVPKLSRLAALGLAGIMIGATIASLFVLDAGVGTIGPVILFAVACLIAWGRRSSLPMRVSRASY